MSRKAVEISKDSSCSQGKQTPPPPTTTKKCDSNERALSTPSKRTVYYSPKSLQSICLDTISSAPERCLKSGQQLLGIGEVATADLLFGIIAKGKLTIRLVGFFNEAALQDGHTEILKFLESLDIFAAIPLTPPFTGTLCRK